MRPEKNGWIFLSTDESMEMKEVKQPDVSARG
jgi:hypothetical protein